MSFLKRLWGYMKTWFRVDAEKAMDPEIEIEQARDDAGKAREMAKQALLKAEDSSASGDVAGQEKWMRTAQARAMKLQAAENNLMVQTDAQLPELKAELGLTS